MTLHSLPLVQRLALSYAPADRREDMITLLLLDERLASILRDKGEVMIAQIKLAWWRDRLGEDPQNWPLGEPLLERLRTASFDPAAIQPLVNGWERLLDESLDATGLEEFGRGRGLAWAALCRDADQTANVTACGRHWALADLSLNLGLEEEAAQARTMALGETGQTGAIPKALRPLAVLHGLSRRALRKNSSELLAGPGSALLALRIGLLGR